MAAVKELTWRWRIALMLIAYLLAGATYGVTAYIQNILAGAVIVFSPAIWISVSAAFWPWFVYADLNHFSILLRHVSALVSLIVFAVVLCRGVTKQKG